jgi:HNH endonuclease
MSNRYCAAVYVDRSLKLISEPARYFRKKVALDLSFQSESRWSDTDSSAYMRSLIMGKGASKVVVANIQECMEKCIEESHDYEYFKFWADQGFEWISIDGNNRTIAIDLYLRGLIKLPHGEYTLPSGTVVINEKNDTYDKHPKPLLQHIENNVALTVAEYVCATRADLSDIFQNVNSGIALNAQELRNCTLVPYANWVRDIVKKHKSEFENIFRTKKNFSRREVDEFVVSASVITTYGASYGVTKSDRDDAYTDDSSVSKQTKQIAESIKMLCKVTSHAGVEFKEKSSLYNLYMLIDHIRKEKYKILDTEKFYKWFMRTELDRLNNNEILCVKKSGEHRNYASCCTSTSHEEMEKRFEVILKDFKSISKTIVVKLDNERIFTSKQRYDAWVRQNGTCSVTGMKIPKEEINDHTKWQADHIFAYANGGDVSDDNCQLICATANRKKGKKMELGELIV